MTRRLLPLTFAALLSLSLAACGGITTASCSSSDGLQCQTTSLTGGLVITSTCPSPTVDVAACPTAGLLGTCTVTTSVTVSGTTGNRTVATRFYTGSDAAAAQTACSGAGGTWAAP